MSAKKKEAARGSARQEGAAPKASEGEGKEPMGKFFLLVFGIPFVIIIAIGLLMAFGD